MSEAMKKFLEAVSRDRELAARLRQMKEPDEALALAKEIGIPLTAADIKPQAGEMSADELSAVAGGTDEQDWASFNSCSCWSSGTGTQDCFCMAGGGGQADENGDICACVGYGSGTRGPGSKCTCPVLGVGTDDDI